MKKLLWNIARRLAAAVTAAVVFGLAVHLNDIKHQLAALIAVGLVTFVLYGAVLKFRKTRLFYGVCGLAAAGLAAVWIVLPAVTAAYGPKMYDGFDNLRSDFFADKNVLIIVPHQDDDLNLAGGMPELYIKHGSRVSVAFATNGDYYGTAELRFREAVDVLAQCGIPAEDVYFLGFGDMWLPREGAQHIYNSPDADGVWTSVHGANATYGTAAGDSYQQVPYTREAYLESLKCLIREVRPDTIYVNDTDSHMDHKGLSYFFEEAMGEILAEEREYHPAVYKGYCYPTAWEAEDDFFQSLNILSTKQLGALTPGTTWKPYYHWAERVRVPVDNAGLHRLLSQTQSCRLLKLYESQLAMNFAGRVTNGDKVFWPRRTDSVLYNAKIYVGGAETGLLNDFKLLDSGDVSVGAADLGTVDVTGGVDVVLHEPTALTQVGLYDDPAADCNILAGYIRLETGVKVPFGPLEPTGVLTCVDIPETVCSGFSVVVTEFEGTAPGLMEVEAYSGVPTGEDSYFMLVDEDDNVVYDYVTINDDDLVMKLYSYPEQLSFEDVEIVFNGTEGCSYRVEGNRLKVICPRGGDRCTIEVRREYAFYKVQLSNAYVYDWVLTKWLRAADSEVTCVVHHPLTWEGQVSYYSMMAERMLVKLAALL